MNQLISKQDKFLSIAPDIYKDKVHEMTWALFAKVVESNMSAARISLDSLLREFSLNVNVSELAQWCASISVSLVKSDSANVLFPIFSTVEINENSNVLSVELNHRLRDLYVKTREQKKADTQKNNMKLH